MAEIFDLECDDAISVQDYMTLVAGSIDVTDRDALLDHASVFRRLANDRAFIGKHIVRELKSLASGTTNEALSRSSFVLAAEQDFYLRANVWGAWDDNLYTTNDAQTFSYLLAHDHNFHLMSVGYFGPGYETDLYSYDSKNVAGYVGEPVELLFEGRETLSPGRVIFYEASKDVHIQYAPKDISITINLMCRSSVLTDRQQLIFDIERGVIARGSSDITSTRLSYIELSRHLHDENTPDILLHFVEKSACASTRAAALSVLSGISREAYEIGKSKSTSADIALSSRRIATSGMGI